MGLSTKDFLPHIDGSLVDAEDDVYKLLGSGRAKSISFDLKQSPLAFFLYRVIDPSDWDKHVEITIKFFNGEVSALEYINSWDREICFAVVSAVSKICTTRQDAVDELKLKLFTLSHEKKKNIARKSPTGVVTLGKTSVELDAMPTAAVAGDRSPMAATLNTRDAVLLQCLSNVSQTEPTA